MPLLTAGIATPVPFVYAAFRHRSRLQGLIAFAYTVVVCVTAGLTGAPDGSTRDSIATGLMIALWVGGSGHAFAVGAFIRRTAPAPPPLPPRSDGNRYALAELERRRALRAEARALAARDPSAAYELGVGRPDLPRAYDDGGLVDVNHAPARVLTTLPGISAATAARLVERRAERGGFISVEDMALDTDLPPDLLPFLADLTIFLH
ncbi:ComEA family DNA-binding protein [Actinomadura atramentaria]|uniref:ComEA family DNA-binding protein n=1 Tax=Actinomadura atramentaria TaxID=1990 RepID=UPI00037C45B6|nr:helix-hairpin-helix domain-containing protein [Actinomadura atramentaria]